jgi:Methyltransferase domain
MTGTVCALLPLLLLLCALRLASSFIVTPYSHCRALPAALKASTDEDEELATLLTANASEDAKREYYLSREQYSMREFWDSFYSGEDPEAGDSYDWFLDYTKMKGALIENIGGARAGGTVLVLGCGNSAVSESLYADGWRKQINIDFSEPVISNMAAQHADKPEMQWSVADARDLSAVVDSGAVQAVIDKGLLDAISYSDTFRDDIKKVHQCVIMYSSFVSMQVNGV